MVAAAWINLGTVLLQSPVDHDANVNVAHPEYPDVSHESSE
jgi:hypothetical protein